jgi:nicotinamidase-related amidase
MDAGTAPHWDRSALLTIDLQHDFLSDGAFAVPGTSEVLPAVSGVVAAFRRAARPVVHVVRLYLADGSNADLSRRARIRAGASIARPGTPGAQLAGGLLDAGVELDADALLRGELQPVGPDEHVLFKPRWNAFFGTPLDQWLRARGVDTVVVAGCNYPNCPRGTLFGASERDYRAVVVPDAVSGWTGTAEAELAGIGVHAVPAAEVAAALDRGAPPDVGAGRRVAGPDGGIRPGRTGRGS